MPSQNYYRLLLLLTSPYGYLLLCGETKKITAFVKQKFCNKFFFREEHKSEIEIINFVLYNKM